MASKFTIVNPNELVDFLDRMDTVGSESTLRQAAVAGARVVFDEVKLRASGAEGGPNVVSGTLRDAILMAYDKEDSVEGHLAMYLVTWSKTAFYGRFVEFGHKREFGDSQVAAKPFLRPGYEAKKKEAAQAMIDVIQKKAEEAASGK